MLAGYRIILSLFSKKKKKNGEKMSESWLYEIGKATIILQVSGKKPEKG